jgi:hypothetical protein
MQKLTARKLYCLNAERAAMQLCIEWTTPWRLLDTIRGVSALLLRFSQMPTSPSFVPLAALGENYTDCRCARRGLASGYDAVDGSSTGTGVPSKLLGSSVENWLSQT